jgi:hypothetical protein
MSNTRSKIKCAACKKRIPDHEPDLILQDLDGGRRPRYYHTRCGDAAYAAYAAYAAASEKPGAYLLTVRHVEEMAN